MYIKWYIWAAQGVFHQFFFMILNVAVHIHGMREIRLLRWPCGEYLKCLLCRWWIYMCVDKKHMQGQDFMRIHFYVCVCFSWKLKLSGLLSRLSGHLIKRLWQWIALIQHVDMRLQMNAHWYVFRCVGFLNEYRKQIIWSHMLGCCKGKFAALLEYSEWLPGCLFYCAQHFESCKSLSFGNHRLYIL